MTKDFLALLLQGIEQRQDILRLVLRDESIASDIDLLALARQTETFTGSDIMELCRTAAVYRLRHLLDE